MKWKRKVARYLVKLALKIDGHGATMIFTDGQRGMLLSDTANCTVEWIGEMTGCYIFGAAIGFDFSDGCKTRFQPSAIG